MIDTRHIFSIRCQMKLLKSSQGSFYYAPRPVNTADLVLMRHMDELYLEPPFLGVHQLRNMLVLERYQMGRTHVGTLMKRMGILAIYRKLGTSIKHPGHRVYLYLLRKLEIKHANQVWALDTTYIPMARGFVYLAAVLDWAARKVMAAKVAITLETCHAMDVLNEAFARHGTPEIINMDRVARSPALQFVPTVKEQGRKLNMDGHGSWQDNVFVERLWKSVKYERAYLHAYETRSEASSSRMQYLDWYNRIPHANLDK